MLWWNIVCCHYNPVICKEVPFSHTREIETYLLVCNFLLSLVIGNRCDLGYPTFLYLPITFLPKYSFFDPSTQTLCEAILCSI